MNTERTGDDFPTRDVNELQITLVTQLLQVVMTMHHIDELLQWLAYAIVQYFNIQLTQFWANQMNQAGRLGVQLRMIVRQDFTLPEQVVVNDHLAYIVQRIISERRSYRFQPIETIFSSYQTTILKRYGLNYCGACFSSGNLLLPPSENMFSGERSAVPLAMVTLLLSRQSPPRDLLLAINAVLNQAIEVAANRGLLTPIGGPMSQQNVYPSPLPLPHEVIPSLEQLIPRRRQDANLLLSDNPFAGTTAISDKDARRLHAVIDGHANIATLCEMTGMSGKQAYIALQKLLDQHRIELYEPNGQPVKVLPAFRER
jgi:hypothetical protein